MWRVINDTSFDLLWRSVDAFGPDPIEAVMSDLVAWQERYRRKSVVEAWLSELELRNEAVQAVITPFGIKASALFQLFQQQTGNKGVTLTAFGLAVMKLIDSCRGPFVEKRKRSDADYYVIRTMLGLPGREAE